VVVSSASDGTTTPGCVTVTVFVIAGDPLSVTNFATAVLGCDDSFAVRFSVTAPSYDPVSFGIVIHVWFEVTIHAAFEDTATVRLTAAGDANSHTSLSTDTTGTTPGWLTDTICEMVDDPLVVVTVTTAFLASTVAFAAAFSVMVEDPEPSVGDAVNHVASDETLHEVFDETDTVVLAAAEEGADQDVRSTLNDPLAAA